MYPKITTLKLYLNTTVDNGSILFATQFYRRMKTWIHTDSSKKLTNWVASSWNLKMEGEIHREMGRHGAVVVYQESNRSLFEVQSCWWNVYATKKTALTTKKIIVNYIIFVSKLILRHHPWTFIADIFSIISFSNNGNVCR